LLKLILAPGFQGKRILGIWDLKVLPWSIGDPLIFIEMLSILKIRHNAEAVDICIVYNHDNPLGQRRRIDGSDLTSEDAQDYMLEYLPLFGTSPYLGSIFQFKCRKEFNYFLRENSKRYDIFPSLVQHFGQTYNYRGGAPNVVDINKFCKEFGYIPHLKISDREKGWARHFYLTHLKKKAVPVALSLKQTAHSLDRNADPAVWLSFIDKCNLDFPEVIFVLLGLRGEVFDGLRDRPNVIIAKDFGTSLMEDLALIRTSFLYMATVVGVTAIALFSDLPYLMFQWQTFSLRKCGLQSREAFSFATDKQKVFDDTISVTPELLLDEFKKIYSNLDRNRWHDEVLKKALNKYSDPTTMVLQSTNGNT